LIHYVQLAFFLPANKHPTSYEAVFRHTVSEAPELGVNVFPTVVYDDLETAIHNAVATVWPALEIKFKIKIILMQTPLFLHLFGPNIPHHH